MFTSLSEFQELVLSAPGADPQVIDAARERQSQLTKPQGSLGQLEELAIWYAGWRATPKPIIDNIQVAVFAGNHGVVAQGISAFPAEVTVQMVANFEAGGAAINQLSRAAGAKMSVHSLELDRPTEDFTQAPAMSEAELLAALKTGWDAMEEDTELLVVGEMGIGNTTSAAAVAAALFGGTGSDWAGAGTGLDGEGISRKAQVVDTALALHGAALSDPLQALRCVGGRELAAMTGAMAHARVARIPVILDGFICCASAAVLYALAPEALGHAVAGHVSAEQARRKERDCIWPPGRDGRHQKYARMVRRYLWPKRGWLGLSPLARDA
ncbi:MAG: nicotinate-nucleotide--dimethylbenzimidazole phosphoribosyltransferase [Mangrovicoccus sp.]